jgi:lipopolysaccharide transport system ATP-binding protein
VYRGETVGIVGRNGSGKSTLLNLICGTLEESAGELTVSGHLAPLLTLGAGFDPEFTGRENVLMNAAIIGLTRAEIDQRLDSIVDFAGIGEFFDRAVKSYSTGMYARLAFAVAINADPEIMVIDEILSVGDEAFARKCHARLEELKASGSTILFVSHNSQIVIELCDRAVLLESGERLLTAKPRDVVAYYHKLLYAQAASRTPLIEEIRKFDEEGGLSGRGSKNEASAVRQNAKLGSLDPGLRSESRSEYERLGAQILDVQILNQLGDAVNVLMRGGEYTYTYDAVFTEDAYGVQFGMMIKSGTGLDIAGQVSHSEKDLIDHIPAHHRARVNFPFRADLAPGTYFVNAGVKGVRDGEMLYLHRILDAMAFRVEPMDGDRITGRIDLSRPGVRAEISPED